MIIVRSKLLDQIEIYKQVNNVNDEYVCDLLHLEKRVIKHIQNNPNSYSLGWWCNIANRLNCTLDDLIYVEFDNFIV